MAIIIDFAEEMKKRFFAWASEYLKIPADMHFSYEDILLFLVEKKVFTLDEICKELRGRKIVLPITVFDFLERRVNNGTNCESTTDST